MTVIISFKQKKGRRIVMSDNFNMYDQANQQGNPNIPPMPPMEEKKGQTVRRVLGMTWIRKIPMSPEKTAML